MPPSTIGALIDLIIPDDVVQEAFRKAIGHTCMSGLVLVMENLNIKSLEFSKQLGDASGYFPILISMPNRNITHGHTHS